MSAPKNKFDQNIKKIRQEAGQPVNEQDRVGYAIISKVNEDTSQVKVKLLQADGKVGAELRGGFFPVHNPLSDIHHRFGALREGLVCRIFWKGRMTPQNVIVEVIGEEDHLLLAKKAATNKIEIGPFQIFSGGLGM